MKLYMNYPMCRKTPCFSYGECQKEFELVCWDTDGKGTNVAISLTEEQAKKVCDIIGLLGFAEENGKIVGYHRKDQE